MRTPIAFEVAGMSLLGPCGVECPGHRDPLRELYREGWVSSVIFAHRSCAELVWKTGRKLFRGSIQIDLRLSKCLTGVEIREDGDCASASPARKCMPCKSSLVGTPKVNLTNVLLACGNLQSIHATNALPTAP